MKEPKSIREAQDAILDILKEYDRVCRKNKIKYSLHGGSLLGAIREKGFIPWDDDADVTMTRNEYNKLLACFNRESEDHILIESFLHMPRIIRKNLDNDTVFAWLDIMIYDPVSENKFVQKLKIGGILFFQAMCRDKYTIKLSEGKSHGIGKMLLFKTAYLCGIPFSYERKYRWFNWFCKNCFCGKKQFMHRTNDQLRGLILMIPKDCLKQYILVPFEDTKLMVMKDYDVILRSSYGDNYMTPIRDYSNDDMHVNFRKAFMNHLNAQYGFAK